MNNKVFEFLVNHTNEDCANIILSFYQDLIRTHMNKVFKTVYPFKQEVWKESTWNNDGFKYFSRLIMHNPFVPSIRIAVVRSYLDQGQSKYYQCHNIDKYMYIYNKQHRCCTNTLFAINKRSQFLHMMDQEKEVLLMSCQENKVKAYKSWKKVKIVQALLKA